MKNIGGNNDEATRTWGETIDFFILGSIRITIYTDIIGCYEHPFLNS